MRLSHLPTSLCLAILLGFSSTGRCSESAQELIEKGDVYYAKLVPSEALKFYLPAEKLDPNNAELLVRIARQ